MENPQGNRIGIMLKKKEGDVQGKTELEECKRGVWIP